MKLYRRELAIDSLDEMHLEVDHYLTPVKVTEEKIENILKYEISLALETSYRSCFIEGWEDAAKAIMQLLTEKIEP